MPKLTVDGREIEVAPGTTVLQAALSVGIEIPHYCWHPGLSVSGNCRMCLVEVEKAPKLQIACATEASDGMVVRTGTERVLGARAAMMEFFLIHHPLDCPICDQAGECRLQEYAVEHGAGRSRYVEAKLRSNKAVDIGPHVLLDQERCIRCSRCVRFCDEVTKTSELAFFRRGESTRIGIHPGRPLANPYSGNVVDLCPVGALTLKEFRFQTRVWFLKNTPTVCAACARGCNVLVAVGQQQAMMTTSGQLDDRIKRIVPRPNEEVHGHWICDEGRLSYKRINAPRTISGATWSPNTVTWTGNNRTHMVRVPGKGRFELRLPDGAVKLSYSVLKAEEPYLDEIVAASVAGIPWRHEFPNHCIRCGKSASWLWPSPVEPRKSGQFSVASAARRQAATRGSTGQQHMGCDDPTFPMCRESGTDPDSFGHPSYEDGSPRLAAQRVLGASKPFIFESGSSLGSGYCHALFVPGRLSFGGDQAGGQVHRHAFHESGADDEAGGIDSRYSDFGCDHGSGQAVVREAWQDAG